MVFRQIRLDNRQYRRYQGHIRPDKLILAGFSGEEHATRMVLSAARSRSVTTGAMVSQRLLEEVRAVMQRLHYSIHTERTYCAWVEQFVRGGGEIVAADRRDCRVGGAPALR